MRLHSLQLSQDRIFAPIARRLGVRVPPLLISFVALLTGVTCALLLRIDAPLVALLAWLLHRAFTGLDGTHARTHGSQSELGGFLDRAQELTVTAAVLGVLVLMSPSDARALLVLLAALFVNAATRSQLSLIAERQLYGAEMRGEPPPFRQPRSIVTGVEVVLGVGAIIVASPYRSRIAFALALLFALDTLLALAWGARRLRRLDIPWGG